MDSCFGVPIPSCMRDWIPADIDHPARNPKTSKQIDDLVLAFGEQHNRPEPEIADHVGLARGLDDLVIILERPSVDGVKLADPYKTSPITTTLQAINELIKYASGGARHTSNVSVIYAHPFKPEKSAAGPTDLECHNLCSMILCLKRPQVIITCMNQIETPSHWLFKQLKSSGVCGIPKVTQVHHSSLNATHIASFDPQYCLSHAAWDEWARYALVFQFMVAMNCIDGITAMPSWAYALSNVQHQDPPAHLFSAGFMYRQLLSILREVHGINSHEYAYVQSSDSEIQCAIIVQEIYNLLWRLPEVTSTANGFTAARLLHFAQNSLHKTTLKPFFIERILELDRRPPRLKPIDQLDEIARELSHEKARSRKMANLTDVSNSESTNPRAAVMKSATAWEQTIPNLESLKLKMSEIEVSCDQLRMRVDGVLSDVNRTKSTTDTIIKFEVATKLMAVLEDFLSLCNRPGVLEVIERCVPGLLDQSSLIRLQSATEELDSKKALSIIEREDAGLRIQNVMEWILPCLRQLQSLKENSGFRMDIDTVRDFRYRCTEGRHEDSSQQLSLCLERIEELLTAVRQSYPFHLTDVRGLLIRLFRMRVYFTHFPPGRCSPSKIRMDESPDWDLERIFLQFCDSLYKFNEPMPDRRRVQGSAAASASARSRGNNPSVGISRHTFSGIGSFSR